ncbi:hypothetical protein [Candidatus Protofrankia californiensis]|uniref:hypothetical protein n=1 Tax=Candidatus Protofrankia californiensis TaxID=1839754 RepID=UPI0010418926|nr:hypothetical protein [Candidatus Protofrankia californiensis]
MVPVSRWWTERNSTERLDLYCRWSVYALSASEPLVALALANSRTQVRPPGLIVFLTVVLLHMVVCIALLRSGLAGFREGRRPNLRTIPVPVAVAVALTVACLLAGWAAFPDFTHPAPDELGASLLTTMIVFGALAVALTPLLSGLALLVVVLLSAATTLLWGAGTGLAGLGERLAGLGGRVATQRLRNGRFLVEASLPAVQEAPPATAKSTS